MHDPHEATLHQPMPTGALATFVAIVRCGTISGAANELHLSQPAVSRRLQGLEEQIGILLFDRVASKLRITAAGSAFLPHAERSLAAETDAIEAAQDQAAGPVGTVKVAIVGSLIDPLLTQALRAVVDQHPGVDLNIATATSSEVCALVRRGDATLGVSYAQPRPESDEDLQAEMLMTESLVVVCSPTHASAGTKLNARAIRSERWLVFPDQQNHPESASTIARRTLEQRHVDASRLHAIDSLSAQRALVRSGYGLALLPQSMVAEDLRAGTLQTLTVPLLRIETPITLTTRTGAYLPPAAQVVVDVLGATSIA